MISFRTRLGGVMLVMGITLLSGCASVVDALRDASMRPSASITGTRLADLNLQAVDLVFDIQITNPMTVALPLVDIGFGLATDAEIFLSGRTAMQGSVPAGGNRTIQLPISVDFSETLDLLSRLRPGQVVPYTASLTLAVDAPGLGPLELPLNTTGEFPIPNAPSVDLGKVEWTNFSLNSIAGVMNVDIGNTNEFPFELSDLSYSLSLAGADVTQGVMDQATSFAAKEKSTLRIPIGFSPLQLGVGLFNALKESDTSYNMAGNLSLDTQFGKLDLPYDKSGSTEMTR